MRGLVGFEATPVAISGESSKSNRVAPPVDIGTDWAAPDQPLRENALATSRSATARLLLSRDLTSRHRSGSNNQAIGPVAFLDARDHPRRT